MVILDTNVVSELLRPVPSLAVEAWLAAQDGAEVYFTSMSEAELRRGIAFLPAGRRRDGLARAVEDILVEDFQKRILPFDSTAARSFAVIAATRRAAGRPISEFDCQIAAIAHAQNAAVATRNAHDFEGCGITVIDPWKTL